MDYTEFVWGERRRIPAGGDWTFDGNALKSERWIPGRLACWNRILILICGSKWPFGQGRV
jgi:hypothetical protein